MASNTWDSYLDENSGYSQVDQANHFAFSELYEQYHDELSSYLQRDARPVYPSYAQSAANFQYSIDIMNTNSPGIVPPQTVVRSIETRHELQVEIATPTIVAPSTMMGRIVTPENPDIANDPSPSRSASLVSELTKCSHDKFYCPYFACPKVTLEEAAMIRHQINHTFPHKCPSGSCVKRSLPSLTLSGRLDKHTSKGKAYYCNVEDCKRGKKHGNMFKRKDNARNHIRKVHGKTEADSEALEGYANLP